MSYQNQKSQNQKTFKGTIKAYRFDIPKNDNCENLNIKMVEVEVKESDKWESTMFLEKDSQNAMVRTSDALNLSLKYIRLVNIVGIPHKGPHSYDFKDLMVNFTIRSLILPLIYKLNFGTIGYRENLPKFGLVVVDGPYKYHGVWLHNDGNKYVHYVNLKEVKRCL